MATSFIFQKNTSTLLVSTTAGIVPIQLATTTPVVQSSVIKNQALAFSKMIFLPNGNFRTTKGKNVSIYNPTITALINRVNSENLPY
jgi:hypothetical protein